MTHDDDPLTLDTLFESGQIIYGLNTVYGGNCVVSIPQYLQKELPVLITCFLGCALGPIFNEVSTRAIIASTLVFLATGNSGVTYRNSSTGHDINFPSNCYS